MKTIIVCFMVIFACSCFQTVNNSPSEKSNKITRHDEIRKIMREHYISDLEDADFLTDEEHDELRRLKRDYYADFKNRDSTTLVVPGRGWEIRGPLSFSQFEDEMIESYEESLKRRKKVYDINERVEDSETGKEIARLKGQYKEGDEIYFFKSDERSWVDLCGQEGYVLICENKLVNGVVTAIN